jgi:tripartite-type tricarboxylate transporter receptor subunit TctC
MSITRRTAASCLAVFSLIGSTVALNAQTPFEGKTITITVGFAPGGGYDAYARLLAQSMRKQRLFVQGVAIRNPGLFQSHGQYSELVMLNDDYVETLEE